MDCIRKGRDVRETETRFLGGGDTANRGSEAVMCASNAENKILF